MTDDLNSAEEALKRFSTKDAAEKYNRALIGTKKHLREMAALEKALIHIPSGSSVLDFPCGTGRLYSMLKSKGYDITAVDSSYHMVSIARNNQQTNHDDQDLCYGVSDVLKSAFTDNAFDAVVCNRLFHHFFEADIRRAAFSELNRISRNTVVVSYYRTGRIDAVTFKIKNTLRRITPTDRVPITADEFESDAAAGGLRVVKEIASRSAVSMQTYAVLKPL